MIKGILGKNITKYRLEFRHITVLVIILIAFQVILGMFQKSSLRDFIERTQIWYLQDSAERIANLATNSLELLIENVELRQQGSEKYKSRITQSLNILLSQQLLEQNVDRICLFLNKNDHHYVIDEGIDLFNFINNDFDLVESKDSLYSVPLTIFNQIKTSLKNNEEIYTEIENEQSFHIFVPFTPNGEYMGALYMNNTPDFDFITQEFFSSYDELAIVYSALILLGLLTMYYISSYTLKERNLVQEKLFEEKEKLIKANVDHEKESIFTKRIYHTHHKAEKVMGFIKEDLRGLTENNIEDTKFRVTKYANFISRVIYDMKWYDPPVQTFRNPIFNTDLNDVIKFVVDYIFLRVSSRMDDLSFQLELDENVPNVHINEFVVWEIIEPLIQNSIDHGSKEKLSILITTKFRDDDKKSIIIIEDDGVGIPDNLLKFNENDRQILFDEYVSAKKLGIQNRGYGCYIAYELAVKRCGWKLSAENNSKTGAKFIITISH